MKFDIAAIINGSSSHQVNCVEIYLCPNLPSNATPDENVIPVKLGDLNTKIRLSRGLGAGSKTSFLNYHYRDMCYTYDRTSDAQRVTQRTYCNDHDTHIIRKSTSVRLYAICFKEDTLPTHRFPCTRELAHKSMVTRTSYRVNNRLFLHHETVEDMNEQNEGIDNCAGSESEYMYLRYNHAPQVDLVKTQQDIDHVLNTMCFNADIDVV